MFAFGGNVDNNVDNNNDASYWPNTVFITGLAASMAVNTLMTGMIVFRILKVTRAMPITSIERTLGSTGGDKLRHVMFIIIESGMALFAIQLVRVVLGFTSGPFFHAANDVVIVINQMLNVIIIRSIHLYFFYFSDNIYLARVSHRR